MKKSLRFVALCLALLLIAVSAAAFAETADANPVLVTIDGEPVTLSDVNAAMTELVQQGTIADASDYAGAVRAIVSERVIQSKIEELKLDQFTKEEEDAFMARALEEWENALNEYAAYFVTEDTEEARAKAHEDGDAYYRAQGYSEEYVAQLYRQNAIYEKLQAYILEGKNVAASEEDIRSIFEEYAAQDRDMYEGNVYMYEIYKNYYGADSWYIPEGYRGIIHILLNVDSDLLSAYQTAQAAFEETVTDEAPEGDAAAKAARDEAFNAVLASKQAQIDDIYARLEKGESFADLIAEYGEDPGMQDKARLASGYEVHKDSVVWDPVFTSAAFSEKMTQPGDTSDPVVGSRGIHILHYLRDIPGGYIELSDEIRASISQ